MNNLILNQNAEQGVRQHPHLAMSTAMQQAFHVLQMPVMELEQWLKNEIEQNPALEYEEEEFSFEEEGDAGSEENMIDLFVAHRTTLFEHLMTQAQLSLSAEEIPLAETLIGSLDHRGFLTTPLHALFGAEEREFAEEILKKIQAFDPPGIGAPDLQASLLIQLSLKGKKKSLAYPIVQCHFDDLIHNRLPQIQKALGCTREELQKAIYTEIAHLDMHPGSRFHVQPKQPILPDLSIFKEEEKWQITIHEEILPAFQIAPTFLAAETSVAPAEKQFLHRQIAAGKWLQRIVSKRHKTLYDIASLLVKHLPEFLSGDAKSLKPLTMQEVASASGLHISTIARAVSHKYLYCCHGLVPLRTLFTHSSVSGVKELLQKMVREEDKNLPFSDELLAEKMETHGFSVARRTITKYRRALKIAPASQRRRWR